MNGIQHRKAQNFEKPIPGCLGRMVNLFDLGAGVAGNKLLTDRPHHDGSPLSRSRSDVTRTSSPIGDEIEDKLMVSELSRSSSNRKSNGTPMKMLIAQEMSKDMESKQNPPNLVAKLMGLDALPQQPEPATQRSHSNGYSRGQLGYWQQENGFLDKQIQSEAHQCDDQYKYKDVYEIWQQSRKNNCLRDKSPQKGRHNESSNEKKMALVRQKFDEAKRLATDEKTRQSKEFHEALEVLSSNPDYFLKFLQEPNSMFSQNLYELRTIPAPPETKRITVLKPSKILDDNKNKSEKQIKRRTQVGQLNGWNKNEHRLSPTLANYKADDHQLSQPTKIVLLKPSPGKVHDVKAMVSPPSSPPRRLQDEDFYGGAEDEARESREVAKEITRQMRENLGGHRRDETLLSSVFSNGYVGDESSFNQSENEYAMENLSDSEAVTPTSRHSWDFIHRYGSPYSSSSFSRASYSPESSVCREAKKRLSERWAMMASNGTCQEQRHLRRSSSTLGEMLALSDMKKSVRSEEENCKQEQDPRGSTSCSVSDLKKDRGGDEDKDDSPWNLLRSKSVPVSSTAYGSRLNVEVPDPGDGKAPVSDKQVTKERSLKSSFKGKVSSLFFSKNKRSSKEKASASRSKNEAQPALAEPPVVLVHHSAKNANDSSRCVGEAGLSPGERGSSTVTSSHDLIGTGTSQTIFSCEGGLSVAKPSKPGNSNENQDQPSPISVLEPPFEDDDSNSILEFSRGVKPDQQGKHILGHSIMSNMIDKSPPIESIARTLSWDEACSETTNSYPLKPTLVPVGSSGEEERDWLFLVQTLLSTAAFDDKAQTHAFFARWHSPESPLNPLLRDKYTDPRIDKEPMHESKRRQLRSNRALVFDCVNAALVDMVGHASAPPTVDQVWGQVKEWFWSEEVRCGGGGGDENSNSSVVVERVVRKEVVGKGWVEHMKMEVENVGKEIEGKLLEELVEEAVVELTGRL